MTSKSRTAAKPGGRCAKPGATGEGNFYHSEVMQLKLDELIRATKTSHNAFLEIEELSDSERNEIKSNFTELADVAREEVRSGKSDLGSPEIRKQS